MLMPEEVSVDGTANRCTRGSVWTLPWGYGATIVKILIVRGLR